MSDWTAWKLKSTKTESYKYIGDYPLPKASSNVQTSIYTQRIPVFYGFCCAAQASNLAACASQEAPRALKTWCTSSSACPSWIVRTWHGHVNLWDAASNCQQSSCFFLKRAILASRCKDCLQHLWRDKCTWPHPLKSKLVIKQYLTKTYKNIRTE